MSEEKLETPSEEDLKSCAILSTHIDAVIRGECPHKAIAALVISLSQLASRNYCDLETLDGIENFAHRIGNSVRFSIKTIKGKENEQ